MAGRAVRTQGAGPATTRILGVIPAMHAVLARSVAARQRIGTVAVSAVGMFAGGGDFGAPAARFAAKFRELLESAAVLTNLNS